MSGRRNTREDFWRRVSQPSRGCWLWQGYLEADGYSRFRWGGRSEQVHRVAWMLTRGPIPDRICVLHSCDVRACCRPSHLFLGTKGDNARDMALKGRSLRGERHNLAKLTDRAVRAIRRSEASGVVLARRYKVTRATISFVRLRKIWRHI